MTERQRAFADHYLATGNGAEAARRAGYSKRSAKQVASRMLTNDDVLDYIHSQQGAIHDERMATVTEVLRTLTAILRGEITGSQQESETRDRIRAGVELLKRSDRLSVNDLGLPIVIDDVPPDERKEGA